MKMPVQHQAKVLFSVLAISLITVYQNCNSTRFQTENQVEAASTTPQSDQDEDPSIPTPTIPQTTTNTTLPPTPEPTGTYSFCPSQTVVVDCPDKRPNCKCTDTLPAGRHNSAFVVRAAITATPNANGLYSHGASCKIAGETDYLSHSGTVTSLEYGTCLNYCSVLAYCVDGQWQNINPTW